MQHGRRTEAGELHAELDNLLRPPSIFGRLPGPCHDNPLDKWLSASATKMDALKHPIIRVHRVPVLAASMHIMTNDAESLRDGMHV